MYFIYVDESGKPNYKDLGDYVLCAVITRENKWYKISTEMNNLKSSYFDSSANIEFHATEIFNGKGVFRRLEIGQRDTILTELVKIMVENELKLISVVFQKYKSYKKPDINEWSFRLLLERLNKYLEKINFENFQKSNPMDYGLLMIDSVERKFDMKIRKHILDFYEYGSHYLKNKYLIEDPIFVKSHFRNLSQLADLSAFLTMRYFDIQKPQNEKHRRSRPNHPLNGTVERLFQEEMIKKLFDNKKGKVYGYGIKFFP